MLELVAPAGGMDSFRLAVANGADAVYIGLKSFSARQYADNFDPAALAEAVKLAHLHRVRVYVALNTLIRGEEMEGALVQARLAEAAGVDAVIVQDLGFLRLLRENLPDLRLHASTQMTTVNAAGLRSLGRLGVVRAVLARETTEAEMRDLTKAGPEIEVFVHGALCYSYSGQCLMSSIIGGRSGNRGRCAQPCRLEYELVGPDGRIVSRDIGPYKLSPRDLCLLPYLARLQDAGVHALKIEGRMKRPEYVGTVVRVYRRALDRLTEAPADFRPIPEEERDLEQIFNRGFTPGFFTGVKGREYLSHRRPNNRGMQVGRVESVSREDGSLVMALTAEVHSGDEMEIWVSRGGRTAFTLTGMTVGDEPVCKAAAGELVTIPLPAAAVRPSDRVFRVNSAVLNEQVSAAAADLRLPFYAEAYIEPGLPLRLVLSDDEGNTVEAEGEVPAQPARNRPLTGEIVREHLARTGGSDWRPEAVNTTLAPGTMLPLSELNRTRRAGLAALSAARLAGWRRLPAPVGEHVAESVPPPVPVGKGPTIAATVGDPAEAKAALAAGADRLYLASWLHEWPDEALQDLLAAAGAAAIVYALPRVVPEREADLHRSESERVHRLGLHGLRVGDLGLAEELGSAWDGRIYLDFSLNVFNHVTLDFLLRRAICAALSPELTLAQIGKTVHAYPGRTEAIVHGRLEMMLSAHCPLRAACEPESAAAGTCSRPCSASSYALRDRMGMSFPLTGDRFCRVHVLNSLDLSMLPELSRLADGIVDLRLETQGRGAEYAGAVVCAYRKGLRASVAGTWTREQGLRAEKALAAYSPAGFTRGHFFRGVD